MTLHFIAPRVCPKTVCINSPLKCPFGFEKDENGNDSNDETKKLGSEIYKCYNHNHSNVPSRTNVQYLPHYDFYLGCNTCDCRNPCKVSKCFPSVNKVHVQLLGY